MLKTAITARSRLAGRLASHLRAPLIRNGYALILSAAATSGLGFVYWMLATRYYPPEVVGLNSAVLSAMLFVSGVAQLSLLSVMTRFLPRAGAASGRLVGAAYLLTLAAATLAGLLFALGARSWSPALAMLGDSPLYTIWFVLATMMWCIFTLQDSVLAGLKQTLWVPIENAAFALAKIALLLLCGWWALPFGIFASWTIPGAAVLIPVNYLIFRRLLPRHAEESAARSEPLRPRLLAKYAASNYLGSMLSLAVSTLLPLVVVHRLGPRANAYFAQPWLIASSLQLIAGNMSVSLTVEAAADRDRLASYTRRALAHSARLLTPLVAAVLVGAPYMLRIFGPGYAAEGTGLLRLLALGALPNLVNMLYIGVARVQNRAGAIVAVQGMLCALTLGLSHFWLARYGIAGVGLAWLVGQALVAALIALAHLRRLIRREHPMQTTIPLLAEALAGVRGLFASLLLIGLLVLRQFAQAAGGPRARAWASMLQLAIVPLLAVFGLTIALRLAGAGQAASTQPSPAPAAATLTASATPTQLPSPTQAPSRTPPPSPTPSPSPAVVAYTVRPGDMLARLALRFSTTVEAIVALNPGINPDSLVVGQSLRIPAVPQEPMPTQGAGEIGYTIRADDTLASLAARYNTSVAAILALNPRLEPRRLAIGQPIRIPAGQERAP